MPQLTSPGRAVSDPTLLPKVHLALTGLLGFGFLLLVGFALAGRVHFGKPVVASEKSTTTPTEKEETDTSSPTGGRYQIEKVDDLGLLLDGAGKLGFFGQNALETWVFKYKGGYLECFLETDINDKAEAGEPLPNDWPKLLKQDEAIQDNKAVGFEKHGYIILVSVPSTFTIVDAIEHIYAVPLFGVAGATPLSPLHPLMPVHHPVLHRRPYRLFLSANPMPKAPGSGFNLWSENEMPIRGPVIPKAAASEDVHVGGGKDLKPGKDILLLERQRGYSRVRLKVRFLGDGEVRDLAAK